MKIRNLAIIFSLGLFAASCTDKAAQEEITKMKADMAAMPVEKTIPASAPSRAARRFSNKRRVGLLQRV